MEKGINSFCGVFHLFLKALDLALGQGLRNRDLPVFSHCCFILTSDSPSSSSCTLTQSAPQARPAASCSSAWDESVPGPHKIQQYLGSHNAHSFIHSLNNITEALACPATIFELISSSPLIEKVYIILTYFKSTRDTSQNSGMCLAPREMWGGGTEGWFPMSLGGRRTGKALPLHFPSQTPHHWALQGRKERQGGGAGRRGHGGDEWYWEKEN